MNFLMRRKTQGYLGILVLMLLFIQVSETRAQGCNTPPPPTGGFNCAGFSYTGTGCVSEAYTESLIGTESGGNYLCDGVVISSGIHAGDRPNGRYQFMDLTRQEVAAFSGLPCDVSDGDFAHCPALQDACFQELNRLRWQQMQACGATAAVGTTINGVLVTESGLLAAAHLGGAGGNSPPTGACGWVASNGASDPNDQLGTSLTGYARTHGGIPAFDSTGGSCTSSGTPPSTPPAACSGSGSPFCTATDIGSPVGGFASLRPPPPIPALNDFLRCLETCDNSPSTTNSSSHYLICQGSPPSGCCCPGQIWGGAPNNNPCPCCFGIGPGCP